VVATVVSSYGDTGGCGSVTGRRGWETGNGVGVAESRWAESLWARWRRGLWVPLLGWVFVVAVVGALVLLLVTAGSPRLAVADAVRTMATVGGALAVVVTGVFAYRRQALAERDESRADAVEFSRRYEVVVSQIGDGKAAVRLGGVYSLARLADDWVDQRQTCVDVLCAYLRMPFEPDRESPDHPKGEPQVRNAILRQISDRLKQPATSKSSWSGRKIDLAGAYLLGADFQGVIFGRGSSFRKTVFADSANFSSSFFESDANFMGAEFKGRALFVDFNKLSQKPPATSTANGSYFCEAVFSGTADFSGARFLGTADFRKTSFMFVDALRGLADLLNGRYVKDDRGGVSFKEAEFHGDLDVLEMEVRNNPDLSEVEFFHERWPKHLRATNSRAMS
jgi:uncharacterized protein YjbI with pentapeptide repeats